MSFGKQKTHTGHRANLSLPSPPPGGLPEAKLTDLRKDYLDAYNDDIVARAQKVQRKLDWLIQVNQQKLAQLEQESTGFAVQQANTVNATQSLLTQVGLASTLKNIRQMQRVLGSLASTAGCFNYYAFAATLKKPRTPLPSDNKNLDLSLISAIVDDKGIKTKSKLIDQDKGEPPSNDEISQLIGNMNLDIFKGIQINQIQPKNIGKYGLIETTTDFGKYILTSEFTQNPQIDLKAKVNIGAHFSNFRPLIYTWPAPVGVDLNKMPIPMYKYHSVATTREAINAARGSLMFLPAVQNTLSPNPGFYKNICYYKNYPGALGVTDSRESTLGTIGLANPAFSNSSSLKATIVHELSHRLDLLNKKRYSIIAESELNAAFITEKLSSSGLYASQEESQDIKTEINKYSEIIKNIIKDEDSKFYLNPYIFSNALKEIKDNYTSKSIEMNNLDKICQN